MNSVNFVIAKSFHSFENQLQKLERRKLIIENRDEAINHLKQINYYRFTGYGLSFKVYNKDQYIEGTTFNDILRVYYFDWEFKNILLKYLTIIEIAFRTKVAYFHAKKHGPIGYKNPAKFHSTVYHEKFINVIEREVKLSDENFIEHHDVERTSKDMPLWVVVEILSFSALSNVYRNLLTDDAKNISNLYKTSPVFLSSWMHTLSYVRNLCAHHARIYNKKISIKPRITKKMIEQTNYDINNSHVFTVILILYNLLDHQEREMFLQDLINLIKKYKHDIELYRIGFPDNWENTIRKL